ncbi:arylsulfatase [Novosphingobium mathurense]|uniref:Arylsulfatase n=1 Tax=Novosphingobium mathurense TaxID=428990 RepID=A0A1U6I206_9SPHN|nr:arylsulfatase [Novosphingobium mathurense]SLK02063.1 arylsulfatase [Novosphingobium mathurense]
MAKKNHGATRRMLPLLLAGACGFALPIGAIAQEMPQAAPPEFVRHAPTDAPNVVVILLDDVGWGSASTFGGPVATPALDALAKQGLSYTRFHTTAICSPTRTSLLTGRNAHASGIGAVMNSADARPGYSGFHRKDTATIAEVLRQHGYATGAFGKWHQTPDWEASRAGPFDRWPTGEGFDTFYGFLGGETDQFTPTLYEGTAPVDQPRREGYHLSEDLADHSIAWMREQRALRPDHPFFLYLATGGIHAPIQAPDAYIAKYKGSFDMGWDKLREQTFARQKAMGLFPADASMPPRPPEIPAWDSLSREEQAFAARTMEAYAGFLDHTDAQVGRVLQALKDDGQFDNTLVFYVVGDNGASLEGGLLGSLNYLGALIGLPQDEAAKLARIGDAGTARSYTHVNSGWAWAADTPFQWGKAMPAWLGAIRNPLVISWPEKIGADEQGQRRNQFGHVNDIAPTILEAAGIAAPKVVNGVDQRSMDGTSLIYSFDAPHAPERHTRQYFEVFGSRALYENGWFAAADHGRLPWKSFNPMAPSPDKDEWRLYDLDSDPTQVLDLADSKPARLAQMQAAFLAEAARNDVLPIEGQHLRSGLPELAASRRSVTYPGTAQAIPEPALPKMANRSWRIEAKIEAGKAAKGVIAALGGHSAGWSLWLDEQSRPVFTYRLFDLQTLNLRADTPLKPGSHSIAIDFAYDGGGYGKGGNVALTVDGKPVGSGRLHASTTGVYTIDETFDVGRDRGSSVAAYPPTDRIGYPISGGAVDSVTISLPERN